MSLLRGVAGRICWLTACVGVFCLTPNVSQGQTLYWDTNDNAGGFGTAGGTWAAPTTNNATQGWTNSSNGTTVLAGTTTTGTSDGVNFGTAADGLGAGTINVSGTVNANSLTFGSASGAIMLSGGTIGLGGTTPTVTVNNASNTISSVFNGATTLTKNGTGTLILSGTNTYSGNTTVSAGTLQVGGALYNAGTNSATITIASGSTLSVTNNSTHNALGFGAGATWAVSGTLVANSGSHTLSLPGNITMTNGTVTSTSAGPGTYGSYYFNAVPATQTVTANGASNAITATRIGTSANMAFNTPLSTDALSISSALGGAGIFSSGSLTKLGNGTLTLSGANGYTGNTTITQGTLRLGAAGTIPNGSGFGNVVFDTAANTATLDLNGLDATINGLVQGTSSTTNRVVNNVSSTNRTFTFGNGNATSAFAGIIADNTSGNGTLALVKTGTGTLTLNGTNTFTGGTTVNQGTLSFSPGGSGPGRIRGTLTINAGGTVSPQFSGTGWGLGYSGGSSVNTINIVGGQLLFSGTAGNGGTAASVINMTGGTIGSGGGGGTFDWYFGNTTSPDLNTLASATTSVVSANINLRLNGNNNDLTFNVADGAAATDLLVSGNITASGGASGGRIVKTGAGRMVFSGDGTYAGNTTISNGTLQIGNATTTGSLSTSSAIINNASLVFNRTDTVTQGTNFANNITGTGSLTQNGSGLLVLGANAYTGATTVAAGTLAANGALSTTSVTVQSGARLQGSGSIVGSVTINDGGTLATGNSIESMATGALSLTANSTFAYEMDNDAASSAAGDLTAVTGNLTLDTGNAAILSLTELGSGSWSPGDKLTLISYSGTWNGGIFEYAGSPLADDSTFTFSGIDWTFNYNDDTPGTNFVPDLTSPSYVTMVAVPEPSAIMILGAGVAVAGIAMARRRFV